MKTHLVISGGACYGISMLGILNYLYLEKKLNSIKYIASNSIGSFFSLVYCLNVPLELVEEIIREIIKKNLYSITNENFSNLFIENGIFDTNNIMIKIKKYIEKEYKINDITFIELSKRFGKNLYISTTQLKDSKNKIFSVDETPNISVFDAVAASMALPFIMKPIKIEDEYYIDGVLSNNFPINIFNNIYSELILSILFLIDEKEEDIDYNNIDFITYSKHIFKIILDNNTKLTTEINYKNFQKKDILIINDLPIVSHLPYIYNDEKDNNSIDIYLNDNDIDNLILEGFIKISEHFKYIKS